MSHPKQTSSALAALMAALGLILSLSCNSPSPAIGSRSAAASAHVDNPFSGAAWYLNPDYQAQVQLTAAQQSDTTLKAKMLNVAGYPTAIWLDSIASISGTSARRGLAAHLDAALVQASTSPMPVVVTLVLYDLPNRDCAALATNGELTVANSGLANYKTSFVDPIAALVTSSRYGNLRIAVMVEPGALPSLVTSTGVTRCGQAQSSGAYVQGIQYAVDRLNGSSNVYVYLDAGGSAQLGWPSTLGPAVSLLTSTAAGTARGLAGIDGVFVNAAGYGPAHEPFLAASQTVSGNAIQSAGFYKWNPQIEEATYAAALYAGLVGAGWPSTTGVVLDTSRNGWGGSSRPPGASSAADVNTFVGSSRIDRRAHRSLACNVSGAGIGAVPQAAPTDSPSAHLDAYLWIKPPGESDGSASSSTTAHPDSSCDPSYTTSYGVPTGALANAPGQGSWFATQFTQLVQNAYPAIPAVSQVCTSVPSSPGSPSAAAASSSQIGLTWAEVTPPSNCTVSYNVFRGTSASFSPLPANQVASGLIAPSFTDGGLAASTTYYYVVQAVDAAGSSGYSTSVGATTFAPACAAVPSAPTGLTAAAVSSSQIGLTWADVTPPPNCRVTYSVYRATNASLGPVPSNLVASGLSAPSFTDGGLAAATTYFYVVQAVDAVGSSAVSSIVSATTRAASDTQAPTAPAGLAATAVTSTTVTLSWRASSDDVGVIAYDIYSGSSPIGSSAGPGATLSNLLPGTTYTFAVRARDAAGNVSAASSAISVTTLPGQDVTPPSAPSTLSWAVDGMTVLLSWGASTDDTGVVAYDLLYGNFYLGAFTDLGISLIGFKPGTPYTFTVRARDGAGNTSVASNQVTVLLSIGRDTTPPTAPSNLAAGTVTSSAVALSWTASTDDVGVVVYQVYAGASAPVATTTSTRTTVGGLMAGIGYTFTVKALDAAGNVSNPSAELSVTTVR
jgi:cellulose 1,4-beta-cellobiosidase